MANVDAPFGLRPIRYRDGSPYNGAARPYYIPSSYGTALYVGDPVIKVTNSANSAEVTAAGLGKFPAGTLNGINKATAGDGNALTGVIVGFAPDPNNLGRVYNPASTERVAWVADDPQLEFEIQADGTVTGAMIGFNAVLIFTHGGSTVTGQSGVELDTTSDVPAADASNQLTILGLVNSPDNALGANARLLVSINQHTELTGAIGI